VNFAAENSLLGGKREAARQDAAGRFADFEALYSQTKDLVRRCAYAVGGAEDLEDIVQESFVKIWKSWQGFRGDADPKTWVYRVALNTAREHWRKRGRYKAAVARYSAEPGPAQGMPGQSRWELRRSLEGALAELSYEQREAVTLCYFEGLSLAEAASALDAPEGTLKSRLFSARKILAGVLAGFGDDS
jgi:RNA polymerase sigma-70 factor (ECF subfamily)